uniref:Calcineurin-like phosphoesterase domain-containing protein n=1 Tax=Compsopogon caeruleus TaxID=31354 RepID=A0A7S1T6Y3_9RHOD
MALLVGLGLGWWVEYSGEGRGSSFYNAATSADCDKNLGRRWLFFFQRYFTRQMCTAHDGPESWSGIEVAGSELRFFVIGDWGRDGWCCQTDVGYEMARAAEVVKPAFLLNVGDNFYQTGVASVDDEQWQTSWRGVYLDNYKSMETIPWLTVLGNHDYGRGDPTPQLQYAKREARWVLPDRQYTKLFHLPGGATVLFAFIDTTPTFYNYSKSLMKLFNVSYEQSRRNMEWLDQTLTDSNDDWKVVVSHHPILTRGSHSGEEKEGFDYLYEVLRPVLLKHKVAVLFSGHDHDMQHLDDGELQYVISGAGSQVRDLSDKLARASKAGRFGVGRQGFAICDIVGDLMHLQFVDYRGTMIYATNMTRTPWKR